MVALSVGCWTCNPVVVGFTSGCTLLCNNPRASYWHPRASVTKQYNLVLVWGQWRPTAGKVIVGLAKINGSLLLDLWLISPSGLLLSTLSLPAANAGPASLELYLCIRDCIAMLMSAVYLLYNSGNCPGLSDTVKMNRWRSTGQRLNHKQMDIGWRSSWQKLN